MIPKIIHFCWLSNDPYPQKIQSCIDSWKAKLPDYEIRLWNFERFARGKSQWVDQAFDNKKYAFAADYIRAYALYNYGGIYLDSDVEVVKSFNDFISLPYMLGAESDSGNIEAAVMGAEKGMPLFKRLLEYYDNRQFVKADGTLDMLPMPILMNDIVAKDYVIKRIDNIKQFDFDQQTLSIFAADYFSPIHVNNRMLEMTKRTVAIHHFAASWSTPFNRFKKSVQHFIGPKLTDTIIALKAKIKSLCR